MHDHVFINRQNGFFVNGHQTRNISDCHCGASQTEVRTTDRYGDERVTVFVTLPDGKEYRAYGAEKLAQKGVLISA